MSSRKRHKGLFFCFELRPYRYGIAVSIGQTKDELRASFKKLDRRFGMSRTDEVLSQVNDGWPGHCQTWEADAFVYLRDMPMTVQGQGVVVHELLHAVRACMLSRNIKMGGINGQEAYCYLLEEAWNEVMGRVAHHIK